MNLTPNAWLPSLVELNAYGGDWPAYVNAVHQQFTHDFIANKQGFRGRRIGWTHHPEYDNKCPTFWHMISEGKIENDRTPDLRRCERIAWARAILNEPAGGPRLCCWTVERNGRPRILLAPSDFSYLVVLNDRGTYVHLVTAYPIERENHREKLRKEWSASPCR